MDIVHRFGCVLPTMAALCWCIGSEEVKCIFIKPPRILLIPGIHYFDAHRLQPLLLQAPALQVHMRESSLVGPDGAGEQVDGPSSDEEQATTASETEAESEEDDENTPPEEPTNPTGHGRPSGTRNQRCCGQVSHYDQQFSA